MTTEAIPTVLTIAGTDPTGGAGLIADVKTISALGGYALTVPTAVIAQNSHKVGQIMPVPSDMVAAQLEAIEAEFPISAVKIGLLPNIDVVEALVPFLARCSPDVPVVLDPVFRASAGGDLTSEDMMMALKEKIFPHVSILTPNLGEIAALLECPLATTRAEMVQQAQTLWQQGPFCVLLKGGHLCAEETSPDLLVAEGGGLHWYEAPRLDTPHGRGTGCTLSSALAYFSLRHSAIEAVSCAKDYVFQAITTANQLGLTKTRGPLNHFG